LWKLFKQGDKLFYINEANTIKFIMSKDEYLEYTFTAMRRKCTESHFKPYIVTSIKYSELFYGGTFFVNKMAFRNILGHNLCKPYIKEVSNLLTMTIGLLH
jgi:hypothetical protein